MTRWSRAYKHLDNDIIVVYFLEKPGGRCCPCNPQDDVNFFLGICAQLLLKKLEAETEEELEDEE